MSSVERETQQIIDISKDPKTDQQRLSGETGQDEGHSLTLIPNDIGGTSPKPSDVTASQGPLAWVATRELLLDPKSEEALLQRKYLIELEENRGLILGSAKPYGKTDKKMGDKEIGNDLASRGTGFGSLSRGLCESTVHQHMLQPISAVQVDIKKGEEQLKSYKNHIQSTFPIMQKGWLEDLGKAMSAFLAKPSLLPENRSACNSNIFPPLRERSPTTALILLVLALGKICDWKAPFPELGLVDVRNWGREGLEDGGLIPGLAYYAEATSILGNLHGGTALWRIQAGILAALYASLAGYVHNSSCWIEEACTCCQTHVRKWVP